MILYLHGLNSSGRSHKAATLREGLPGTEIVAPDYPAHQPTEAMRLLSRLLQGRRGPANGEPLTLVGSSMGGFYGHLLAGRVACSHLFLINPALRPAELLAAHIGETMTTARGERYAVTDELVEAFRGWQLEAPCAERHPPTTLLLEAGDEVIDYRIAAELYRPCAQVLVYDGGDHAFQNLDEAVRLIGEAEARGSAGSEQLLDDPEPRNIGADD